MAKRLARPSADDLAEIARGKGSARDKREAAAFGAAQRRRARLGRTKRRSLR